MWKIMLIFEVISMSSDELAIVDTVMSKFMWNHTSGIITVKFNHHIKLFSKYSTVYVHSFPHLCGMCYTMITFPFLTPPQWVTRIYASVNQASIDSDNGLSPIWCQSLSKLMLGYCQLLSKFFYHNTKLFIHENASENIVCEMGAILSRGRWVKLSYQLRI